MCKEDLQRIFGRVFLLPFGVIIIMLLRLHGRYRINNLSEVRRKFKELLQNGDPLIICPNHLTLIDSVILLWAFAPLNWYLFNYRFFSWNLPAIENVKSRISWRIITFVTKCMLLDRRGNTEYINQMLDKVRNFLLKGELVTVFPEGTRSRSGFIEVDNATYGIGKILQGVPDCRVLCVYLRGINQITYSDFPAKGEVFDIQLELIRPQTEYEGLRAAKDVSMHVIKKLKSMEERYFKVRKVLCAVGQ